MAEAIRFPVESRLGIPSASLSAFDSEDRCDKGILELILLTKTGKIRSQAEPDCRVKDFALPGEQRVASDIRHGESHRSVWLCASLGWLPVVSLREVELDHHEVPRISWRRQLDRKIVPHPYGYLDFGIGRAIVLLPVRVL